MLYEVRVKEALKLDPKALENVGLSQTKNYVYGSMEDMELASTSSDKEVRNVGQKFLEGEYEFI